MNLCKLGKPSELQKWIAENKTLKKTRELEIDKANKFESDPSFLL